jgi:methionine-rich copper-binding protein CopC
VTSRALRRAGQLLAVVVVLAFGAVLGAGPAAAHSVLLQTSPVRGGTVETAPATVALTFNEMPQGEFSTIHVTAPDGQRRDDGHVQVVNDVVSEPLAGSRPAGRYVVDWRVVSADGHPVSGEFTFTAQTSAPQFLARPANPDPAPAKSSNSAAIIIGVVVGVVVIAGIAVLITRRRSRSEDPAVHE